MKIQDNDTERTGRLLISAFLGKAGVRNCNALLSPPRFSARAGRPGQP